MKSLVRAQQGRPRRLAVAIAVLCAWGVVPAGAAAQLDKALPAPEPVQKSLQQPLPGPAEDVVRDSPADTVRDTVRGTVGAQPGGSSAGGSGNPGASTRASAQAATGRAATGTSSPPVSSGSGDDAGRTVGAGSGRRSGGAGTRATRSATAAADRRAADARPRRAQPASDDRGPVARRFSGIAEVVPTQIWIALMVLAALALALAGRSAVEGRRRGRLEREREQLLGDVGLLQRALLPEVPARLGTLAASVAYRPADGPAAGGDFYDAFDLPGGRVGAILGDVSGHGREALVRTAAVRHSLRTLQRSGLSPREALAAAGRLLTDEAEGEFVTVVAIAHDPGTGELTYATAGHPPPIVCGPVAHEPVTVASSPPLGLGLPTGLRQTTISLPRGSVACLYTDGLLEARMDGELVGRERLEAMVAGLGPYEGAERLLARMLEETDEAGDDMAACVLRALEGPEQAGPRTEEIEVGPEAADLAAANDVLRACGVPEAAAAPALEGAASAAATAGGAVVVATIGFGDPSVAVKPRAPRRLRPSAIAASVGA